MESITSPHTVPPRYNVPYESPYKEDNILLLASLASAASELGGEPVWLRTEEEEEELVSLFDGEE